MALLTPEQLKAKLKKAAHGAMLDQAAIQLVKEAVKWTPVHTTQLRKSVEIKNNGDGSVNIKYKVPYARRHYFSSLRHLMLSGLPSKMTDYAGGTYQQSYRAALRDGVLRRVANGLQWLHRALRPGSFALRRIRKAAMKGLTEG